MTQTTLIRDITDPVNQLVNYGSQQVGFYDGFRPTVVDPGTGEQHKSSEPSLYIYINNGNDKFSTVRRKARKIRIKTAQGTQWVDETKAYARAYQKYTDLKNKGGLVQSDNEAALIAKVAELEAKAREAAANVQAPAPEEEKPKDRSVKDLKEELDNLGVEYKGNASRETLLELIVNNED